MNQNKIFAEIIPKLTSKYTIESKLILTYRFIENDKYLYIVLKFFKNTEYNPYTDKDLYFSITLDDKFPQSFPVVKSLSNFSFPSLYDNSDLYRNILLFQIGDDLKKKEDGFTIVEDTILGLKPFLEKIKSNEEKQIFYYYGEYILDEIYDINNFFSSPIIELFRANQIINEQKFKKYIILNDVYFLLFDPVPDVNNYAKLIFISDIMLLKQVNQEKNEKKIIMEFRDYKYKKNEVVKLCFEFEKKYEEFLAGKNNRIEKLIKFYKVFDIKEGKDSIDNNEYNTKGLQISKSFESEL